MNAFKVMFQVVMMDVDVDFELAPYVRSPEKILESAAPLSSVEGPGDAVVLVYHGRHSTAQAHHFFFELFTWGAFIPLQYPKPAI